MRILVTGGAGYIGSHTVRKLLDADCSVRVFDNLSLGHRAAVPTECLYVGDLDRPQDLDRLFSRERLDAVIHFAASALVGESVRNPAFYYRNNVIGSLHLLEAMRRHGVTRLVFSSTCATYGQPTSIPIREDFAQNPINPYGATKLTIERAIRDYVDAYGWSAVILRYFNAAGASHDAQLGEDHKPETHLIPLVIQTALGQRDHIRLLGTDYPTHDGTCVRDYVHVEDLAEAHFLALEAMPEGMVTACNIGTGRGYSNRQVIQTVEDVSGRRVAVEECERREGDPPTLIAQTGQARKLFGWEPRYQNLHEIIETAWAWHERRPNGYTERIAA
jgi:UDP-glucose-4-epimerase GalE